MASVSGGDKITQMLSSYLNGIDAAPVVEIGFMADATYPEGTQVALVAAVNEFGAPSRNIPPRPFFRNMIADKKGEWAPGFKDELARNGNAVDKALGAVGEVIAGQLRESITTFEGVPLKPATITRKGSTKQLVDTGVMLASVAVRQTNGSP
jgi:hypothetical protein